MVPFISDYRFEFLNWKDLCRDHTRMHVNSGDILGGVLPPETTPQNDSFGTQLPLSVLFQGVSAAKLVKSNIIKTYRDYLLNK